MAARFLVTGGNGNWTSTTNWSATSGGSSGASAPTSADDVTLDSNSGSQGITTDTSARACLSLNVTSGYTGTLTMTNQLTVGGSCTLGANMTIAGSGLLITNGGGTLTSNGKVWPNAMSVLSSNTFTVADAWTVNGLLTIGNTSSVIVMNGSQFTAMAGMTIGITSGNISGTTILIIGATGTVQAASNGRMILPFRINATGGTVTINSVFIADLAKFTYTAGTVVTDTTWSGGGSSSGMSRSRTV